MIPKKIHYCWFGRKPIPKELLVYIDSWHTFCPDYEIKLWNEDSFDVNSHPFTKSAYEAGKFAFVSDFVRVYALFNEGGVYLDTDVELTQNIDDFLRHEAFSGFELRGSPITAVWGSIKNHSLPKKMIDYYQGKAFKPKQEPNTRTITDILINIYNIQPNSNTLQVGTDGTNSIHIYPAETFCLDIKKNYAIHHFSGSWIEQKNLSVKNYINMQHLSDELINYNIDKIFILNALAKRLNIFDILKILIFRIIFLLRKLNPCRVKG